MTYKIGTLYQSKTKLAGSIAEPRDLVSIACSEVLESKYRTFPARTIGLLLDYEERFVKLRNGRTHDLVKMLIVDKVIWMRFCHLDKPEYITGISFFRAWRQIDE